MPTLSSFDYAVLRVVPRVEREEFFNAGVILFCLEQGFLDAIVHLDEKRAAAFLSDSDREMVERHLEAFPRICAGDPEAGPIARLAKRERFHWLVAPRSTMIQVSPVHSGLCDSAESTLKALFDRLVRA